MLSATLADGHRRGAVWSSEAALVVSRRDMLLAGFNSAKAALSREGMPLLVRDSGGTAVLPGPGIVTLSLVHAPCSRNLDESYESLRAVDGAFCDGKHNLVVDGRKFAGTAQRRQSRRFTAALAHAVLLIDVDVQAMTRGINRFYSLAGATQRFSPDGCFSLRELPAAANYPNLQARAIADLSRAAAAWVAEPPI
jgi:lipoate-protein ligase A